MAHPRRPKDLAGRVTKRRKEISDRLSIKERETPVAQPENRDPAILAAESARLNLERIRKNKKIAKIQAATDEKNFEKVEDADRVADGAEHITKAAEVLSNSELGWITAFTSIITLPLHVYKIIHAAAISKASDATRGKQIAMGIIGIGVGVLAFVGIFLAKIIAAPFIVIASTGKAALDAILDFSLSIRNYFSGRREILNKRVVAEQRFFELVKDDGNLKALKDFREGKADLHSLNANQLEIIKLDQKLTRYDNKIISLRENIGSAAHRVFKGLLGLAGGILLLLIPPVGAKLLLSSALYNIADTAGANPFKWLGRGINAISKKLFNKDLNPFARKQHHETIENISEKAAELKLQDHSKPTDDFVHVHKPLEPIPELVHKQAPTSDHVLDKDKSVVESSTALSAHRMSGKHSITPLSQDKVFSAHQQAKQKAREKQELTRLIFGDKPQPKVVKVLIKFGHQSSTLPTKDQSGRSTPTSGFKKKQR